MIETFVDLMIERVVGLRGVSNSLVKGVLGDASLGKLLIHASNLASCCFKLGLQPSNFVNALCGVVIPSNACRARGWCSAVVE